MTQAKKILEHQVSECCEKYVLHYTSFPLEQRDSSKDTTAQWTMSPHRSLADFFSLLFPRLWWQTGRLLKVIRAVSPGSLKPRWCPGHIPKWSCCSRPQQRQALWGATLLSPWRWGDRLAMAQNHTFMVSDSASPRRLPLPNSSCTQVVIALTPNPKPFILSSFFFLSLLKQAQCGLTLP